MQFIQTDVTYLDQITNLFDQYMVFYKKPSDKHRYKAYISERLTHKEATVYMAFTEDGHPVGFVLNYHSFSSVSLGKVVVLNDLFVLPKYRNQGIAERLIQCSFRLAKETGAIRVDLGTAKDNLNAQRLYEKIGFVRDDEFYAYSYSIHS